MYQNLKLLMRRAKKMRTTIPKQRIGLIVLALFLLLAYFNQNTPDQVYKLQPGFYHVTQVNDGDTIEVEKDGVTEKVRLIGIDTPETHHPDKPVQCYGVEATQYTRAQIQQQGNQVKLVADALNDNRDRYDRLVRYVYLKDGSLLNSEIIEEGYGFSYQVFSYKMSDEFKAYERIAERNNKGLWNHCVVDSSQYVKETRWP